MARAVVGLGLVLALAAPSAACALSLAEAIALARRGNPDLSQAQAGAQAAEARLAQARAGRRPSLVLSAEAGEGTSDLGGFFGFGEADVSPRAASLDLRQPVFTGGGAAAAVDRARGGRDAALAQAAGAKALLSVQVAQAYVGVLSADELLALHQAQARQMTEIARQAGLRFTGGETARTDLAQAQARLAEARAGVARAQGEVARSRARFAAVVGVEPEGLELEPPPPPPTAGSLDEALARAAQASPALIAAEAAARAAEAGARQAQAERLPSLALTARAAAVRDQFFPGYQSDGVTVGVQGRWTLFSGGAISGRVAEARAQARAGQAALAGARTAVREAVIGAWQDIETTRAVAVAAADQATAAASALDSVRNEVRVGQKPTSDLLDAEREALAAKSALVAARGGQLVAAYRLAALVGDP